MRIRGYIQQDTEALVHIVQLQRQVSMWRAQTNVASKEQELGLTSCHPPLHTLTLPPCHVIIYDHLNILLRSNDCSR